jgi:PKD repeat protein
LVVFNPLADADIESIEWDFGDGTVQNVSNGNKVRHIFKSS